MGALLDAIPAAGRGPGPPTTTATYFALSNFSTVFSTN